jgi:hypothetical protein
MEFLTGLALGLVCALPIVVVLWIEIRAFREMNAALGAMILEVESARREMVAGVIGAIRDRATAEQTPEGTRPH